MKKQLLTLAVAAATLSACSSSDSNNSRPAATTTNTTGPSPRYEFNSKFVTSPATSSVNYTGQNKRNVILDALVREIAGFSEGATGVKANLDKFYRFNAATSDSNNHGYLSSLPVGLLPGATFGSIDSGKDLVGKTAGNDTSAFFGGIGGTPLIGWQATIPVTFGQSNSTLEAEDLIEYFFSQLTTIVEDNNTLQVNVVGNANPVNVTNIYIDQHGRDYRQLIQKFVMGAIAFSQGTDDYLQTDFTTASQHARSGTSSPYSIAEHKWDEAFGYFGAAINYTEYSDDEIAAKGGRSTHSSGYNDANNDGQIDLRSEVNVNHSVNCAKRDRGGLKNTDFTKQAYDAFYNGRKLLNDNAGRTTDLPAADLATLNGYIATAALTWEKCIAATAIHYINDTRADIAKFQGTNYADLANFQDYAKHWGELKGFALILQFNPNSPFNKAPLLDTTTNPNTNKLLEVLNGIGDAPVLADGNQLGNAYAGGYAAYSTKLLELRAILRDAYGFTEAQVAAW